MVGALFDAYNEIGFGFREKHYHYIFEKKLNERGLRYKKEKYSFRGYKGAVVAKYFLDFVIEDKIAVEIKVADGFYKSHQAQLLSYLNSENLKLGILAIVTPLGLEYKRFVN